MVGFDFARWAGLLHKTPEQAMAVLQKLAKRAVVVIDPPEELVCLDFGTLRLGLHERFLDRIPHSLSLEEAQALLEDLVRRPPGDDTEDIASEDSGIISLGDLAETGEMSLTFAQELAHDLVADGVLIERGSDRFEILRRR